MTDCFPTLRKDWWGIPESLHLDCWGELKHADGYDIALKSEPYTGPEKLWFINLGGYQPGEFTELHKNVFVVAPREVKARAKALAQILDWRGHHKDAQFEVEKIINLDTVAAAQGLHIHLTPNSNGEEFKFSYGYKPIGKAEQAVEFTSNTSVRQLAPDEWPLFKEWRLKALKSDAGMFSATYEDKLQQQDDEWQKFTNSPDTAIFIVYDHNEAIGLTAISIDHKDLTRTQAVLWGSWLKPEYRSRGISKQLYAARLTWARQQPSIKKIIAGHRASNIASRQAILKHGFTYTSTETKLCPDGETDDVHDYELIL